MSRTVDNLLRRVREELKASGPDGGGYSDWLILDALNTAIDDLAEVFPVRDIYEFTTSEKMNTYILEDYQAEVSIIYNIHKVEYDNRILDSVQLRTYTENAVPKEGAVNQWALWGTTFILIGEVGENKLVTLWVSRSPKRLEQKDDKPETPTYADEAIIAYALSVAYRSSKDFDRANYYYRIYSTQKTSLLNRGVPENKSNLPQMRDSYMGPHRANRLRFARKSRFDN